GSGPIEIVPIAPPDQAPLAQLIGAIERGLADIVRPSPEPGAERHIEVAVPGETSDEEVRLATEGAIAHHVRANSENELIVSVAVPVRLLKGIIGVLQLSTVGGEVERFVLEERKSVLEIFVLAAMVSILLSIVLANMIAAPIRALAHAASRSE